MGRRNWRNAGWATTWCPAVREKIDYCHNNPVKRGLVTSQEEWRWSSFNWYMGPDEVPLEMEAWE